MTRKSQAKNVATTVLLRTADVGFAAAQQAIRLTQRGVVVAHRGLEVARVEYELARSGLRAARRGVQAANQGRKVIRKGAGAVQESAGILQRGLAVAEEGLRTLEGGVRAAARELQAPAADAGPAEEDEEEESEARGPSRSRRTGLGLVLGGSLIFGLGTPARVTAQDTTEVTRAGAAEDTTGLVAQTPGAVKDTLFVSAAGDTVMAQAGQLWVPENRDEPGTRLIRLTFVRFPSTATQPGSPIVYLAGGPGGSGILTARGKRFPLFMKLREAADVIAFEQRGTWGTEPFLVCPQPFHYPLDQQGTWEAMLQVMLAWSRECAGAWKDAGLDLAAYNTNANADDLEALRVVLGAEKLNLWGISYGTHLALAMLRRHPESVDRAILAGVEGPDQTLKTPGQIQRLLERVDSLTKEDEQLVALVPDFLGLVKSVITRLEEQPVTVKLPGEGDSTSVTFGAFDIATLTANSTGDSNALAIMPLAYLAMSQGRFGQMGRFIAGSRTSRRLAMTMAMDCASGATAERKAQILREEGSALLGGVVNFPFPEICEAWPHADLGDEFRAPVHSDVPTLFISGTLDGRTPPENAEEVMGGFSRAWHLVLEGASHSDDLFLSDPGIVDIMLAFLEGEAPATTRIQVPFNFQVPGS